MHLITNGQTNGINFRIFETIEELSETAIKEDKYVYVTLHYIGCPYCIKMEKEIFPKEEVGNYYNENFISLSLDINEDILGRYFKEQYAPGGYPAHLYLDKDIAMLHKSSGYKNIDTFINLGEEAKDKNNNFIHYKRKVDSGDLSAETLIKYFRLDYIQERDSLIGLYLKNCNDDEKFSVDTWTLLSENTPFFRSKYFQFILDNEESYRNSVGDKPVDDFLISRWGFMIDQWSIWWANNFQRKKMRKELVRTGHPLTERIIRHIEYKIWIERAIWRKKSKRKWKKMIETSQNYLTYGYDDWYNYHRASWIILANYKNLGKEDDLDLALRLSEESLKYHETFINLYIHACILEEKGDKKKAIITMETALGNVNKSTEKRYTEDAKVKLQKWKKGT